MEILLAGPAGLFCDGMACLLQLVDVSARVLLVHALTDPSRFGHSAALLLIDGDWSHATREGIAAAQRYANGVPMLVLLQMADRQRVDELVAAGVAGCVEKSATSAQLIGAARLVLAGGACWPRPSPDGITGAQIHAAGTTSMPDAQVHLSRRQMEVLALLASGRSNKTIARELDVAEATIKAHLTTIYKTLNVRSRGQASAVALRMQKVIEEQSNKALNASFPVGRLLTRMTRLHCQPGNIIFKKGEPSDALYYLVQGSVRLMEFGIDLGPETLLGEIGLFSPEHRRTSTVKCTTGCELLIVSAADAIRLYYQEPEFAMYLIQLLAERLEADKGRRL
jgi:two-component system nitrate/nitrite response regulator NarL